jgi:hypothetical protein
MSEWKWWKKPLKRSSRRTKCDAGVIAGAGVEVWAEVRCWSDLSSLLSHCHCRPPQAGIQVLRHPCLPWKACTQSSGLTWEQDIIVTLTFEVFIVTNASQPESLDIQFDRLWI